MSNSKRVAILGGSRIPFVRNNTAYWNLGNKELSVKAVGALVEKFKLSGQQLGEVATGAVLKHSSDFNIAREVVLSSGLSPYTPGITVQRACGTSLDTAIIIANKIAAGQIDVGIAAGSDTTSDVPIVHNKKFRRRLLNVNMAKSLGHLNFPAWPNRARARAWVKAAKTWRKSGKLRAPIKISWRLNRIKKQRKPTSAVFMMI
jgi:acetyl-CoA C-acetyltransferase